MSTAGIQIEAVVEIARAAGAAIMEVYEREYEIIEKADGSPVTTADHRAHDIIVEQLQVLTPEILIVSEESKDIDDERRFECSRVWLVDPLDGTKEFIRRNGEFSVNIGLAEEGRSILGVVFCPSSGACYFAAQGQGAWRQQGGEAPEPIQVSAYDPAHPRMVASRSHAGEAVTAFRSALAAKSGSDPAIVSMGSALKVCVVAEGNADVYPRLAPPLSGIPALRTVCSPRPGDDWWTAMALNSVTTRKTSSTHGSWRWPIRMSIGCSFVHHRKLSRQT